MIIGPSSEETEFDVALFALGYEARSIHIPQKYLKKCSQKIAFGYRYNNKLSYEDNLSFLNTNDIEHFTIRERELIKKFESEVLPKIEQFEKVSILLDITSMSRFRFSTLILLILRRLKKGSSLTIKYSVSKFVSPPKIAPPVKIIEPISPRLAGIPGDLNKPTCCIVGLGYEKDKALGAVNYIDPGEVWALIPRSNEPKFEPIVMKNNYSLLKDIPIRNQFFYDVHNPIILYGDLKSIVLGLETTKRPVILPLGPKILCAISVVLSHELNSKLPIWRVSSKDQEEPSQKEANGKIVSFTVKV